MGTGESRTAVVVGGTGRVGGAVAEALLRHDPDVNVVLAGRNAAVGAARAAALGPRVRFAGADLRDPVSLRRVLDGAGVVVHSAGPFQHGEPQVLDAAIDAGVAYADVCDDIAYAHRAKQRHAAAEAAGVGAVTTGGVFPGLSNVVAAELIARGGGAERVAFRYFVAGTGGAGPTVLTTTFLIASEPATAFADGRRVEHRAFTGRSVAAFPAPVGRRATYFFELPEVTSIHETFGVPNVTARFGTAPDIWNLATSAMATPPLRAFVRGRERTEAFVARTSWLIRAVDRAVGNALAMEVVVDGNDGVTRRAVYAHGDTVRATGDGVAQFALVALDGGVAPGVWYPEEAIVKRDEFLDRAVQGAVAYSVDEVPAGHGR